MNKKLIISIVIIAVVLILSACCFFVYECIYVTYSPQNNGVIDTSLWQTSNEHYSLEFTDNSDGGIYFSVKNKNGDTVYSAPYGYRKWDLQSIEIKENNDILVDSGDVGTVKYIYDTDKQTWNIIPGDG